MSNGSERMPERPPAEELREAARLMRERAEGATDGGFGWHVTDELAGANEVWAKRDAGGWDSFMVATTATRLNPNPGAKGHADAAHIASWHPAVALAVAEWLDHESEACGPKRTPFGHVSAHAVARAYLGTQEAPHA